MSQPETSPIFDAAQAKLRRAFQDLHTLRTNTATFLQTGPYGLAVEFEPSSGWWVARLADSGEEAPPDLAVLVGGIAYQCLSAFNHLVWELAARKVGRRKVWTIKEQIHLPVALSPKQFGSFALVHHRRVSKAALAVIEGIQPYKEVHGPEGPHEHPLPLIKEIADSDKHRVLTAIWGQADLSGIAFRFNSSAASGPTQEALLSPGDTIGIGTAIGRVRFEVGNAEANVEMEGQPELDLLFHTDRWFIKVSDVENALKWALMAAERFAPLFPTR